MKLRQLIGDAIYLSIIIVLEFALQSLPNIQLTALLIFIYISNNTYKRSVVLILCYVILDNYAYGFGIYTVGMMLGWSTILLTKLRIFKKISNHIKIIMFSFLYCWAYLPFMILMGVSWQAYLIADLPYEFIFAVCNFLTILWLYDKTNKIYKQFGVIDDGKSINTKKW